jgi:hypothetical protein
LVRSLSLGQRCLLWGYTLLFTFVLPFICWGAVAAPGHPHRTPHFVFADPLLVKTRTIDETANDSSMTVAAVTHPHHPAQQDKQSRSASLAVVTTVGVATSCLLSPTDAPVSGRAAPTLLLFSILLLLLTVAPAVHRLDRLDFACWVRSPLPQPYVCAVPLPPPRLSF